MMKVYADAGNWVTINGVHVLIGGDGRIAKGPAKFIGSTVAGMKDVGKSASDKSGASSKKSSSKETKKSDDNYKEKFSGKSSNEIRESIGSKSMSDSDIKSRIKALDKELIDKNPRDGTTTAEWRDLYSEQKALMSELKERSSSSKSSSTSSSKSPSSYKGVDITKDSSGRDTFTIDGRTYHYEKYSDGTARITYDDDKYGGYFGPETMYGTNRTSMKGFGSASEAIDDIIGTRDRIARTEKLEAEASRVGGIALTSTNRIMKPGTLRESGVSGGVVQYSAKDMNGNTINLTGEDMGTLLINGIDLRMKGSTSSFSSAKNTTKKSTPTTPKGNYPSGIDTPAQKRAYTRALNSGMSSSESKRYALGIASSNAQKYKSSFDKAVDGAKNAKSTKKGPKWSAF